MQNSLNVISNNPQITRLDTLVNVMQQLRLEAGFTQKELATRLKLCRETISAIENAKPETLSTLQLEVVQRWWGLCRGTAQSETRDRFALAVCEHFGFDSFTPRSKSTNINLISQAACFSPPCLSTTLKVS